MKAERKAAHDAMKTKASKSKTDKEKIAVLMQAVFWNHGIGDNHEYS